MTYDALVQAVFSESLLPQYLTGENGRIMDANEAFGKLLGCPREYLSGRKIQDFLLPEDADYLTRGSHQLEVQYQSGELTEPITALATITPIRGPSGSVWMNLTQVQDLSAKRALEQDLRRNAKDLEQFAYIASHDLREPLMTMAGFATLLKKREGSTISEQGKHFIEEIIAATMKMERKIDDLLSFSRTGRETPTGVVDLVVALEDAKRMLGRAIGRSGATIEGPVSVPPLKGDQGLIAQVLQNLISNSLKYRGANTPQITITAEPAGPCCWTVAVKDNGLGFSMEHHDRIFGVFTRLFTSEEYPGTGIGLAIVKKIVERHGGKIWAESTPGAGATFFFTLAAANDSNSTC